MSSIGITTPALLFPAISLLLLAYTNRFLVIADLTRSLYKQYKETEDGNMRAQIEHLKLRVKLIRHMQLWGVFSFIMCTLAMGLMLVKLELFANLSFGLSLVSLVVSLVICFIEVYISSYALNKQIENIGKHQG